MARENIYAAIDVGTTKVCTIVAQVDSLGEVQVLGVGKAPSSGLSKGVVVNIDDTLESVRESVDKAERISGVPVKSAFVGIAGKHITSLNNRGVVAIAREDRLVHPRDVKRALESAYSVDHSISTEVLHVIPRGYVLDGQKGIKDPVGMHGFRLDVECHIVLGASTAVQNLVKAVQGLGVSIRGLAVEPLASAEAVLTDDERDMGVILADIGGGTTGVAVYNEGTIWHTACLPVGGGHFTNDIAVGLRVNSAVADEMKVRYGRADVAGVDSQEQIDVHDSQSGRRNVSRKELCEILKERAIELFRLVDMDVRKACPNFTPAAGLVLTGGTANLPGLDTIAREALRLPVRVGKPMGVAGLAETIDNPAYSASLGLLLWGINQNESDSWLARPLLQMPTQLPQKVGSIVKGLFSW